jgi:hypothetical protein
MRKKYTKRCLQKQDEIIIHLFEFDIKKPNKHSWAAVITDRGIYYG